APLQVACFEPEHHIVEAVAPFFARRFPAMRWAIMTPERSVGWDGVALAFAPGVRREEMPAADADDRIWLSTYRSVFRPGRVKLQTLAREMPGVAMAARTPTDPKQRPATEPQPTPGHPVTPGGERPRSLPALNAALQDCRECPIGEHATQAVGGEGGRHARLMFVGEQPGDQEDLTGHPFVGPAGQLLDRALAEAGIDRSAVYVTNVVKHFKWEPRGKRRIHKKPNACEIAACRPWLEAEIQLVKPRALVCLGATAAQALLGRQFKVSTQRGEFVASPLAPTVLATVHPSSILRARDEASRHAGLKRFIDDLRKVQRALAQRGE
ncbi:MAG TPA: UdgX family uracil-DNA binding protein, partial [Caldimonas sp.]|nr:UdgX family uracil-DNA binding protein [Caldimonas sp.]